MTWKEIYSIKNDVLVCVQVVVHRKGILTKRNNEMTSNLQARFTEIRVYRDQTDKEALSSRRILHSLSGECVGDGMYLFALDCNSIIKIDRITGAVEVQYGDERQPYSRKYLYTDSFAYEGMIYFISNKLPYIMKYVPASGHKKYISHEGRLVNYLPCRYGKSLFLLPIEYSDRIVCVDMVHDTVSYLPCSYPSGILQAARRVNENLLFNQSIQVGNYVYQGSRVDNSFRRFDLEAGKAEYMTVEGFRWPIRHFAFDGECFWLLSLDGILAQWDHRKNQIIYTLNLSKESDQQNILYVACVCSKGAVYILENRDSCILKLNIQKKVLFRYDCSSIPGFKRRLPDGTAFSENIRKDDSGALCFFPYLANGILRWDTEDKVQFYLTDTAKIMGMADEQQVQTEYTCSLDSFCSRLMRDERRIKDIPCIGKEILTYCQKKG